MNNTEPNTVPGAPAISIGPIAVDAMGHEVASSNAMTVRVCKQRLLILFFLRLSFAAC